MSSEGLFYFTIFDIETVDIGCSARRGAKKAATGTRVQGAAFL